MRHAHARNISLEVFNDDSAPSTDNNMWRCLLYGDIYELASGAPTEPSDNPAPKNLHYRRLNDEQHYITVDIFDMAGRGYPDLLEEGSSWYRASAVEGSEGAEAGEGIKALVGLLPGNKGYCMGGHNWKGMSLLLRVLTTRGPVCHGA